jgi:hypothetical protein
MFDVILEIRTYPGTGRDKFLNPVITKTVVESGFATREDAEYWRCTGGGRYMRRPADSCTYVAPNGAVA